MRPRCRAVGSPPGRYVPSVDAAAAAKALEGIGVAASRVEEIVGGWAFWTFDIDGRWIARFPRNADVGQAATRELALLPELARTVHYDLWLEHILGDEVSATRVGMIDFESAWVGDPAVDFVPLHAQLGPRALDQLLIDRDLGEGLGERMWFYRWMGSVHAIIYGVT